MREIPTQPPSRTAATVEANRLRDEAIRVLRNPQLPPHIKQHRTCSCGRFGITKGELPVLRHVDGRDARIGSVSTCGNGWTCAVCARKIATVRAMEIDDAIMQHRVEGGEAILLTLTFPHTKEQKLVDLLDKFDQARQRFGNSRTWKRVTEESNCIGTITALEVKYSWRSGWHPHLHVLLLCDAGAFGAEPMGTRLFFDGVRAAELRAEWSRQLEKVGLVNDRSRAAAERRSLVVSRGELAAAYMVKGGRVEPPSSDEDEVAKVTLTPFGLLAMSAEGSKRAAELFREYAIAIAGKRMLTWSPGLRGRFGAATSPDSRLASEPGEERVEERVVGHIVQAQLTVLTKCNAHGHFLRFVAVHGHREDVARLIDCWIALCDRFGRPAGRRRQQDDHFVALTTRVLEAAPESPMQRSGNAACSAGVRRADALTTHVGE